MGDEGRAFGKHCSFDNFGYDDDAFQDGLVTASSHSSCGCCPQHEAEQVSSGGRSATGRLSTRVRGTAKVVWAVH